MGKMRKLLFIISVLFLSYTYSKVQNIEKHTLVGFDSLRADIPHSKIDTVTEGESTIVIRVINSTGKGGFVFDKPYEIETKNDTFDLKGECKFKVGDIMPSPANQTFIRWKPLGLYNKEGATCITL